MARPHLPTHRTSGKCAAFWVVLLIALPAPAEHAIPYRYTVLGYVLDARGQPRAGVEVRLTREKTGFSYLGETDAAGLYVIVARLGDESAGERLLLEATGLRAIIVARFDPANHAEERGTRVDFTGARAVEQAQAFLPTLRRLLAR